MLYMEEFVKCKKGYSKEYEDILRSAKLGDEQAIECIIKEYKDVVRMKSRSYFIVGADDQDVIQEGLIGLYRAIKDYDITNKKASFRSFAEMCIKRQIITAIKKSRRQKHMPLNTYVSINGYQGDTNNDNSLFKVLADSMSKNPENIVMSREKFLNVRKKIEGILSDLEKKVLYLYVDGKSYDEIADELGKTFKSVDNTLQRIKRKAVMYMELGND